MGASWKIQLEYYLHMVNTAINQDCKIGTARFYDNARIRGSNVYDTLIFSPGGVYILNTGATQTVKDTLGIKGNGCFPITLQIKYGRFPVNYISI